MLLPKPLYDINLDEVEWVLRLPDKQSKKAYVIWSKRHDRLFELLMKCDTAYEWRFDILNKLTSELYERMCAIKYPESVKTPPPIYRNPQLKAGTFGVSANNKNISEAFKEKYFKK